MSQRRGRGEGGLHWDEARQRWIASVTVGYTGAGKRIVRKDSGKTKTEARAKLREKIREYEDGIAIASNTLTVGDAVNDWLTYGLGGKSANTKSNYTVLAGTHIIPVLGARKLRDLSATDVDRWLGTKAKTLSTRTLRLLHSILNRVINRAMSGQGEAQCRRPLRHPAGAGWPTVQVAHPRPGQGAPGGGRELSARLHRRFAADRRSDRGVACTHLGGRGRGGANSPATSAADERGGERRRCLASTRRGRPIRRWTASRRPAALGWPHAASG
jgi:hypothetical protein